MSVHCTPFTRVIRQTSRNISRPHFHWLLQLISDFHIHHTQYQNAHRDCAAVLDSLKTSGLTFALPVFVQSSVFTAKLGNTEFFNFQLHISYVILSKTLYSSQLSKMVPQKARIQRRRVITVYILTLPDIFLYICTIIQLAASLLVHVIKLHMFIRQLGYF